MKDKSLLVEVVDTPVEILEEATQENGGRMKVKAKLMEADIRNRNRRVYPRQIVEREVEKLQERIIGKVAFGSGDHPADGRTSFDNVTHLWEKVWMSEKQVFGEATILNTDRGKTLQEIVRVAGSVPVSARGFGRTVAGQWEGEPADIGESNYTLVTYDFVLNSQGFDDARVTKVTEEEESMAAELLEERQAVLAGLGAVVEEKSVAPTEPLTETQKLERFRSGLSTLEEEFSPEHSLARVERSVAKAVRLKFPPPPDGPYAYVSELFLNFVIVAVDDKLIQFNYKIDDLSLEATLSKPIEVRKNLSRRLSGSRRVTWRFAYCQLIGSTGAASWASPRSISVTASSSPTGACGKALVASRSVRR